MGATATSELVSTTKVSDSGMSALADDALAGLATGKLNAKSTFGHEIASAKAITDQHVAAGNLPHVAINSGDLTQAG